MKNSKMQLDVVKGTSFFIATLDYDPKKQIEEELHWKSATPEILEFNAQTGEVCAVGAGCGTLCAEDANGAIRVLCAVNIEETPASTTLTAKSTKATTTIKTVSQSYATHCTISAIGYTGKSFVYTQSGNRVTLECGLMAQNGVQNYYSSAFETTVRFMNHIYYSLTDEQREAWLVLRAKNFFSQFSIFIPTKPNTTIVKMATQILLNAGIDLGSLFESTINGFYEWFEAEKNAEAYFDAF